MSGHGLHVVAPSAVVQSDGRSVHSVLMSQPRRDRRSASPHWWLVACVLALGGLFAMHGIGDHGSGAEQGMGMVSPGQTPGAARAMPDHNSSAVTPTVDARGGAVAASSFGAPVSRTQAGMDAMCLSVLVSSLWVWAWGRRLRLSTRAESASGVRARGRRSRDRDPPSLIRLSILRC